MMKIVLVDLKWYDMVASFSDLSNQLNYELLTRIAKTIPRKSFNNGFYKIIPKKS
jgi:hypothetical protein